MHHPLPSLSKRLRRALFSGAAVLLPFGCKSVDGPTSAHVASVKITPASPTVFVGETMQLSAEMRDAAGNVLTGRAVTWNSSSPLIATVSTTGLVTALQEGSVVVRATSENVDGQTTITTRTPVATLTLSRSALSLGVGAQFTLAVEARSAQGTVLTGRAATWTTSAAGIATVTPAGVVTAMSPGTATITVAVESKTAAATVTVGGAVATVSVSPPTVTIGAGANVTLVPTVRDAQGNVLADRVVDWSSNNSAVASVSESGVLTANVPGSAIITALAEGKAANVPVTVRAADVAIEGAQLTQTTQDGNGAVPMLSGRAAAVTVLVSSRVSQLVPVEIVLRLLNAANTVVYSDTVRRTMVTTTNPSLETSTLQFLIPAAEMRAGLRWQVERDPRRLAPDDTVANDLYPRGAPAPITVVTAPPLLVRFVPIQLTAHGNATGNVSSANIEAYLYMVRRLLPVSDITATIGPNFTTSASFGTPPSGGAEPFWTQVLQELDLARVASGDPPATHWYGIMVPPAGFNFTAYGGFGYIPFSGTTTGPSTRTALSVQLGWFNSPTLARDNIAHEIGHNFGRRHAPCGGAANPDPLFPVPGGTTGAVGFDVYGWSSGAASVAAAQAATNGDIMSYCAPVWIGPYNYAAMLNFRGTVPGALQYVDGPTVARRAKRAFVVRGRVARGTITFEPAFTLDVAVESVEASTHRLELLRADGSVLRAQSFMPAEVDHANDVQLFTVPVAVSPDEESAIHGFRVVGPEGRFARESPSAAGVARILSGSEVDATRLPGQSQWKVSCPDRTAAGALVRDGASGALLAVTRGADVTVASIAGRRLLLACSDGVQQSQYWVTAR